MPCYTSGNRVTRRGAACAPEGTAALAPADRGIREWAHEGIWRVVATRQDLRALAARGKRSEANLDQYPRREGNGQGKVAVRLRLRQPRDGGATLRARRVRSQDARM